MAEIITIARPYAEAVFDLANAYGKLNEWSQRLDTMAAVAGDARMRAVIGNPNISAEQVYGVFAASCGDALNTEAQSLVRVLIENRRLTALPEVKGLFDALKREREGQVEAQITSAFPLSEEQLAALVKDLEVRFKRKVQPVVSVDSELIGGVRVRVGDEVIDGTVRGKLAAMASALKN
ncbi:MAG: F0F1 ATP synthase subunit delta [Betaproteobacteria bacterium]|nr:F0F1 ATP synthase subunit delta [Betaproteobacteria bacterium]